MPFQGSDKLPAERASKLAHLDVLKSELVRALCKSFEEPIALQQTLPTHWSKLPSPGNALKLILGVDGSVQVIESHDKPLRTLAFVKTAMVTVDKSALDMLDKNEPHPFAIRDLLEKSQIYHATVFPLRNVHIDGTTNYSAIRTVCFINRYGLKLGSLHEGFALMNFLYEQEAIGAVERCAVGVD